MRTLTASQNVPRLVADAVGRGTRHAPARHLTLAPAVDTRIADNLAVALRRASIETDSWKRLQATRSAYQIAVMKAQAALDHLGAYAPDMVMGQDWDDDVFRDAVTAKLAEVGVKACEVNIALADASELPTLVRGTVEVVVGRKPGHDGFDAVTREVSFDAELEVVRVNSRRVAVFHIQPT